MCQSMNLYLIIFIKFSEIWLFKILLLKEKYHNKMNFNLVLKALRTSNLLSLLKFSENWSLQGGTKTGLALLKVLTAQKTIRKNLVAKRRYND